ncbi:MAG TPA: DMT family transporter, partial [Acidimicrobiia bacterium]|nr:DMT family transporter [Acidimicrobiia bacterium]
RSMPASRGVSVRMLGRLARSPQWTLGMLNDVGAFGFQAAALAYGGLLVVQPIIVTGLIIALVLAARWSGRRLQPLEWVSAVLLCGALATFLVEAAPSGGRSHASFAAWIVVAGPILVLVGAAIVVTRSVSIRVRAALLGAAAGALFGITSSLAKTFVEQIQHGVPYTASHWEVYSLAGLSVVGILLTQNGFQAGSLGTSLPALEAIEPIVASLIGITVLHEHIQGRTTSDNVAIALSIVALICAVVALAGEVGSRAERVEHEIDLREPLPSYHPALDRAET